MSRDRQTEINLAPIMTTRCIAIVMVLTVFVGGCASSKDCRVAFRKSVVTARTADHGPGVVELCVGDSCTRPSTPQESASVAVSDEPDSYNYRLLVSQNGKQKVLTGEVETEETHINGEGCPPRTANATLTVSPEGAVTVSVP